MKKVILSLFLLWPMIAIGQNTVDSTTFKSGFSKFLIIENGMFNVRSVFFSKTTNNTSQEVFTSVKINLGEEKNDYQYCFSSSQIGEGKLLYQTSTKISLDYDELVKINGAIEKLMSEFQADLVESKQMQSDGRTTARRTRPQTPADSVENTLYLENEFVSDNGFTIGYIITSSDYTWFYHTKREESNRPYHYSIDNNSYVKEIEPLADDFLKAQRRIEQLKKKYGK